MNCCVVYILLLEFIPYVKPEQILIPFKIDVTPLTLFLTDKNVNSLLVFVSFNSNNSNSNPFLIVLPVNVT